MALNGSAGLSATVKGRFTFNGKLRNSGDIITADELDEVRDKGGAAAIESLKSLNMIELGEPGAHSSAREHTIHAERIAGLDTRLAAAEALLAEQGAIIKAQSEDIAKLKRGRSEK